MKIISDIRQMQSWSQRMKRKGKTVGLVPTMGYLHDGHLSLLRKAREESDCLVMSIFVNPAQFGPREDFKRYPRDFARDKRLAGFCGVDILFHPQPKTMYPRGYKTYVKVEDFSEVLCGMSRPTHFRGVATVVLKFFNIIRPDVAYFGQKDAQQVIIIKRMVEDLNLPIKIRILPIVREKDGLAMSSRNSYLSAQQRRDAAILYKALQTAVDMVKSGTKQPQKIISLMRRMIKLSPLAQIDYIKIVNAAQLREVKEIKGKILIAVAVFFARTRLIDNVVVDA